MKNDMKRLPVPRHYVGNTAPIPLTRNGNYPMKRICLILLFCATAFGESNYEKGRLISITDVSTVTQTVMCCGPGSSAYRTKQTRYRFVIQSADTVYVGLYTVNIFKFKPYDPLLEFINKSDVEVRIEGSGIHLKRPNGKDVNMLLEKRLDRTGKGEEQVSDARKEATRHEHIGRDLVNAGDPEGAENQFRAALRLGSDDAETHYGLGWALYSQKKYTEAMPEFQSALRLNPKHANAHGMVGALLTKSGDLDGAIEELSTSVRLEGRLPSTHYEYGRALEANGKLPEALEEYRRAEKLYKEIRYTGRFDREYEDARSGVQRVEKKLAAATASALSKHE
jgi:tetratricopeptide (TPR) repeat protein